MSKVIPKKSRNDQKGVRLVVEIEVDGMTLNLAIPCQNCKGNDWFLSEDRTTMYCGKCREYGGYIESDIADLRSVGWVIDTKKE